MFHLASSLSPKGICGANSLKVAHVQHLLGSGSRDALPLLLLLELLLRVQVRSAHPCSVLLLVMLLVSDRKVLERRVARHYPMLVAARFIIAWGRDGEPQWIHAVLQPLRARITEAIVVRDGLKHVEPHSAFLAFEVTWLQLDAIQRADGAARSGHLRAQARAELLTASLALAPSGGHAVPLLHVIAFCLFYLADEVVEALMSLSVLDIA